MRAIISLLLCLSFFTVTLLTLVSCMNKDGADKGDDGKDDKPETITVPEYKDYERGTVDFSDISYARPELDEIILSFESVCEKISKNIVSYEEQLELIYSLEEGYNEFLTMYTYANIKSSADNTDTFWLGEYEVLSTAYPSFSNAVEDLFVAAAKSPHALQFESDYFGDNLIEDYADGGKYTDRVVSLMENEAELEADYQALSTATVEVSYMGRVDTVDNILAYYRTLYNENSSRYQSVMRECMELYERIKANESSQILVELFKVRRKISDELGCSSYREFAYETIYHDYTREEFLSFADDVSEFVLPVYIELSNRIFNQHSNKKPREVSHVELINNTYKALLKAGDKFSAPFAYMLQHSLYNIEVFSDERFPGAFTTYLDNYNAPFILASTSGNITDYATLSHEFGHFLDAYYNYNSTTSLDLAEVSSQALELLIISKFEGILSDDDIDFLLLNQMENLLSTIIFQSFYATFEHLAYEIDDENITLQSLNDAVVAAADKTGLNSRYINDIEYVLIPHIVLYPFYVQSYCTSAQASLEIYFKELDGEGDGFSIYEELVYREDNSLTFTEYLEEVGLSSPFEKERLKLLADRVYFELRGSHYFIGSGGGNST